LIADAAARTAPTAMIAKPIGPRKLSEAAEMAKFLATTSAGKGKWNAHGEGQGIDDDGDADGAEEGDRQCPFGIGDAVGRVRDQFEALVGEKADYSVCDDGGRRRPFRRRKPPQSTPLANRPTTMNRPSTESFPALSAPSDLSTSAEPA
jgi:hypothetical protein